MTAAYRPWSCRTAFPHARHFPPPTWWPRSGSRGHLGKNKCGGSSRYRTCDQEGNGWTRSVARHHHHSRRSRARFPSLPLPVSWHETPSEPICRLHTATPVAKSSTPTSCRRLSFVALPPKNAYASLNPTSPSMQQTSTLQYLLPAQTSVRRPPVQIPTASVHRVSRRGECDPRCYQTSSPPS